MNFFNILYPLNLLAQVLRDDLLGGVMNNWTLKCNFFILLDTFTPKLIDFLYLIIYFLNSAKKKKIAQPLTWGGGILLNWGESEEKCI